MGYYTTKDLEDSIHLLFDVYYNCFISEVDRLLLSDDGKVREVKKTMPLEMYGVTYQSGTNDEFLEMLNYTGRETQDQVDKDEDLGTLQQKIPRQLNIAMMAEIVGGYGDIILKSPIDSVEIHDRLSNYLQIAEQLQNDPIARYKPDETSLGQLFELKQVIGKLAQMYGTHGHGNSEWNVILGSLLGDMSIRTATVQSDEILQKLHTSYDRALLPADISKPTTEESYGIGVGNHHRF